MDSSFYLYHARKIRETESVLRKSETPPAKFVKKITEIGMDNVIQYLWDNRNILLREGTRAFVQPDDLIDRSNKPDTTFGAKKQKQYPNAPEETPESKKAPFPNRVDNEPELNIKWKGANGDLPDRADRGQPQYEPILHEEVWPFSNEEAGGFPTPGYSGQGSDISSRPFQMPTTAQHGMEADPTDQVTGMGTIPQQSPSDVATILGNDMEEPSITTPPEGTHNCPVCNMGFDGDDVLGQHMMAQHQVYEITWPFRNREDIPSATYPYER
jgi:hypothetical protein